MNAAGKRSGWSSWSASILLHLLIVAVVTGLWFWQRTPPPTDQRLAIEASVVTRLPASASPPAPEPEPAPPEPEPVVETPPEPAPEPEADRAAQAAEKARREEEMARLAEAEHVAELRRVADARLAAERKAEQAAKEKAEREKTEQVRKQRELAEAERARAQRESELNAQLAAEERVAAARASGQMQQYISQITARIERAWTRPPSAAPGLQCEVRVTQVPGGVVTGVQVTRCNGDESVRRSVEDAVYRASPLPQPSDPALFDRNLAITFRPEK